MTLVGARGVVPVNVLGRGADRWGVLALALALALVLVLMLMLLVWKRAWIWLRLLLLVLVFRLRLKERREVGAFRCISAFFRHDGSPFFASSLLSHSFTHTLSSLSLFPSQLSYSFHLVRVTRKKKRCRNWTSKLETGDWRPLRANNVTGVIGTVLARRYSTKKARPGT